MSFVQLSHGGKYAVRDVRNTLACQGHVILERDDLVWTLKREISAKRLMHDVGAHAGEVVVAEAPIGLQEHAIARIDIPGRKDLVPGDDLFPKGQRSGRRRTCLTLGALRPARKVGLAVGQ
jgi:hypothetical protein